MTDRVQALTVLLDKPMRTDDAEALVNAIKLMFNVVDVKLGPPLGPNDYFMRERARHEILMELVELLQKKV
jgi:hypothetical protein